MRIKKKLDIQAAHFSLGNETAIPKRSYGQDLFVESHDLFSKQKKGEKNSQAQRRKMIEASRKNNFQIGEDIKKGERYAIDTSSNAAYKPDMLMKASKDRQTQMDFHAANFKFGSAGGEYLTTNKREFNDETIKGHVQSINQKQSFNDYQEMVNENHRKFQQFTDKDPQTRYLSIAKKNFIRHDLSNLATSKKEMNANGLELRKTHFLLGHDDPCFTQWRSPTPTKQFDKAPFLKTNAKTERPLMSSMAIPGMGNNSSNILLGNQRKREFITSNRKALKSAQFTNMGLGEEDQYSKNKNDTRKHNIKFGNVEVNYTSQSGNQLIEHPIKSTDIHQAHQHMRAQAEKHRQANFKIQTGLKPENFTSYELYISKNALPNKLGPGRAQLLSNLKQTTVTIGLTNARVESMTEANQQFQSPSEIDILSSRQDGVNNNELKKQLKDSHFQLGLKNKSVQFSNGKRRQALTGEKMNMVSQHFKNDQIASHFKMGFEERPISGQMGISTESKSFQNNINSGAGLAKTIEKSRNTQQQIYSQQVSLSNSKSRLPGLNSRPKSIGPPSFNVNLMVEKNRRSSIVYGQGQSQTGSGIAKTSNQAFYKWIQPVSHIKK